MTSSMTKMAQNCSETAQIWFSRKFEIVSMVFDTKNIIICAIWRKLEFPPTSSTSPHYSKLLDVTLFYPLLCYEVNIPSFVAVWQLKSEWNCKFASVFLFFAFYDVTNDQNGQKRLRNGPKLFFPQIRDRGHGVWHQKRYPRCHMKKVEKMP
jgi:hypothetical protein